METVPPRSERSTKVIIGALAVVATLGVVWILLSNQPISGLRSFHGSSTVVPVALTVYDRHGETVAPGESRYVAAPQSTPADAPPKSTPTPGVTKLDLYRRVPALTVRFRNGEEVLRWLDENEGAKTFLRSAAVAGIFNDVLETLRVRTDDLDLSGVKGMTVEKLAREAISAGGALHFDPFEGPKGFVFSFERKSAPIISGILPPLVAALSRRAYDVTGTTAPVEEITLGRQTLFLTEDNGRVFVAAGLKALLNAMEIPKGLVPPAPGTALEVQLRSAAFLDKLLPVVAGRDELDAIWRASFPAPKGPAQLSLAVGPANALGHLSKKISDGVFAAVPQDVFGAFVTSFRLPPDMTPEDWNKLATEGAQSAPAAPAPEGGFGLIWDFDPEDTVSPTKIGVIVAAPKVKEGERGLGAYFDSESVSIESCGGNTVWIASTSETLLTRMKESCDRQSPSFLNWFEAGRVPEPLRGPQLFLALQPGIGLQDMQALGLASRSTDSSGGETAPEWKTAYDAAVARASQEAEKTFASLPVFLFGGAADAQGTVLQGAVEWSANR